MGQRGGGLSSCFWDERHVFVYTKKGRTGAVYIEGRKRPVNVKEEESSSREEAMKMNQ